MINPKRNSNFDRQALLRYLALGDSYTIGEGVASEESYPYQLVRKLERCGLYFAEPWVVAKTGWTSGELIDALDFEQLKTKKFDLLTLLIGVNNQYRGQDIGGYEKDFKQLMDLGLSLVDGRSHRIAVISIPDWGVTEYGGASGRVPGEIAGEIDAFNEINKEIALKTSVNYLEITNQYRQIGGLTENMAPDGLHPSGKIYEIWAETLSELLFTHFYKK
ncbi:SGNH/GDSL hydrolase family protein [Negadavirga shengliensis]|uniref:SGNH/GDSL hydrolase family protein n=1 Tax=Negadavirga shengliensis TaxID=1389218 RepID=A0ABV9T5G7_9BACT